LFDINTFERLLNSYTTRSLTNDADILTAFSGILNEYSKRFNMSFWNGTPLGYLNIFMACGKSPIRREGFPSWSWIGWKYRTGNFPIRECTPEVIWYRFKNVEVSGDFEFYAIQPEGNGERDIFKKAEKTIVIPTSSGLSKAQDMLICDAERFFFSVSRTSRRDVLETSPNFGSYTVEWPKGGHTESIELCHDWRSSQPDLLEFICIFRGYIKHRDKDLVFVLLLDTSSDGISCRVSSCDIQADKWSDLDTT